jgi:uncharacterized membrane protein
VPTSAAQGWLKTKPARREEAVVIGSQKKRHLATKAAAAAGTPANQAVSENLSGLDRLAVRVTDLIGTMGFFLIILTWTVCWAGYNILATKVPSLHLHSFDPFPAFVAYLLISNVIQILLMPLLMIGQNLQGRHSEARAEADFLVNQKAFADTEAIIKRFEALDEKILTLAKTNHEILQKLAPAAPGAEAAPGAGPSPSAGASPDAGAAPGAPAGGTS